MKKVIVLIIAVILIFSFALSWQLKGDELALICFEKQATYGDVDDLSQKIVRFHVIANSDSEEDQYVKLKVRDAIIEKMYPILENSKSKEETVQLLRGEAKTVEEVAEKTLRFYGDESDVSVKLDEAYFPVKSYGDFTLPAGDYTALRVVIGDGMGKNWWCILFPPLCLIDVKTEEDSQFDNELSENDHLDESYDDTKNEETTQIRWKVLEMFNFYN